MGAYLTLLTDGYPSTVDKQSVRLDTDYPDVGRDLNRWRIDIRRSAPVAERPKIRAVTGP